MKHTSFPSWCVAMALSGGLLFDAQAQAPAKGEWIYSVTPGDTLSGIAQSHLAQPGDWKKLQKLNKVSDPHRLRPDTPLRMPVTAGDRSEAVAEVVWVRGQAQATHGAGSAPAGGPVPFDLKVGLQLHRGDILRTGPDSSVTLRFVDQSRMMLSANSQLSLTSLVRNPQTGQGSTLTTLEKGSAESTVTKRQKGEVHYTVKTPALNLAVRGTVFRVSVDAATGRTQTSVSEGVVAASARSNTVAVAAGTGTSADVGKAPEVPVPLPAAPLLTDPATQALTQPASFAWQPSADVAEYHVELMDRDGVAQLADRRVSTPRMGLPIVPDGGYLIKVRAINRQGLEGLPVVHRFDVKSRAEPPMLREPLDGSVIEAKTVTFRWARPLQAQRYRVQIADTPDFSHLVTEVPRLHGSSDGLEEVALVPGRYFWRVAAEVASQGFGPDSDALAFEVKAPRDIMAPQPASPEVVLRWKAGPPDQATQVQVAKDADFRSLVLDVTQIAPQARLTPTGSDRLFVRLRRLGPGPETGPFEATQVFSPATPPGAR